ncbi:MAG: type II toxin-antitoxin system RelE/ParE family toxin [Planctomycetota bacterium]
MRTRPIAQRDVLEAALYLSTEGNPEIGERFIDAIDHAFAVLVVQPKIGAVLSDLKAEQLSGIRKWAVPGFGNYLIFYRPLGIHVEIIRVLHGSRDIGRILADEE